MPKICVIIENDTAYSVDDDGDELVVLDTFEDTEDANAQLNPEYGDNRVVYGSRYPGGYEFIEAEEEE